MACEHESQPASLREGSAPECSGAAAGRGLAGTFAFAFLVALTGAVTPGPLLALVIGQVLVQGMPAVVMILLGHALVEIVLILLLRFGLGRVLDRPAVRAAIAGGGGLVMAWMGWDVLRHAGSATLAASTGEALSPLLLLLSGAGVSLSNPYFTGWWGTVGAAQIAALQVGAPARLLAFWLGHESGDAAWYVPIAAGLVFGRRFLSDSAYQALLYGSGGAMLLLALGFLAVTVRLVRRPARPAGY